VATVGAASLSLIVPVAEAVPEAIVKVSLVLQCIAVVYRNGSRSSTRRYVTVCEVVINHFQQFHW
jgi:hypothetical protein